MFASLLTQNKEQKGVAFDMVNHTVEFDITIYLIGLSQSNMKKRL